MLNVARAGCSEWGVLSGPIVGCVELGQKGMCESGQGILPVPLLAYYQQQLNPKK